MPPEATSPPSQRPPVRARRGWLQNFWRRFTHENWAAGKLVEWSGNKGRVSGLEFDLNNQYIATALKSRFLFGTYEAGADKMIRRHVDPDLPVVECGACIGVMSCLVNRQLKRSEEHIAVEAQPFLIPTLEANRMRNGCGFEVRHAALAYGSETIDFWINPKFFIGNSLKAGAGRTRVTVPTVTLAGLLRPKDWKRITLVVDVEGAETELVARELELMQEVVDTFIVELHPFEWGAGQKETDLMRVRLSRAGFSIAERSGHDYTFLNRRWHPS